MFVFRYENNFRTNNGISKVQSPLGFLRGWYFLKSEFTGKSSHYFQFDYFSVQVQDLAHHY